MMRSLQRHRGVWRGVPDGGEEGHLHPCERRRALRPPCLSERQQGVSLLLGAVNPSSLADRVRLHQGHRRDSQPSKQRTGCVPGPQRELVRVRWQRLASEPGDHSRLHIHRYAPRCCAQRSSRFSDLNRKARTAYARARRRRTSCWVVPVRARSLPGLRG